MNNSEESPIIMMLPTYKNIQITLQIYQSLAEKREETITGH